MRRTLDIVAVLALVGLLVFVLLHPDARTAWLRDVGDPAWWGSAALDWAIFTVVLAYVLLRLEEHVGVPRRGRTDASGQLRAPACASARHAARTRSTISPAAPR